MAKLIVKYRTTDGSVFDNEKDAKKVQDKINNSEYSEWSNESFGIWLDKAVKGDDGFGAIMSKIFNGGVDRTESEEVLTKLFVEYSRSLIGILSELSHSKVGLPIDGERKVLSVDEA